MFFSTDNNIKNSPHGRGAGSFSSSVARQGNFADERIAVVQGEHAKAHILADGFPAEICGDGVVEVRSDLMDGKEIPFAVQT